MSELVRINSELFSVFSSENMRALEPVIFSENRPYIAATLSTDGDQLAIRSAPICREMANLRVGLTLFPHRTEPIASMFTLSENGRVSSYSFDRDPTGDVFGVLMDLYARHAKQLIDSMR
jgi:hypothetical protein